MKGLVSPFIFTYGSLITMGVCMTATAFTMVPISERASGAKQVQMLTGLGALPYWATHYAWDMLMYVVASVLTMIMLIVFDYQEIFLTQEGPSKNKCMPSILSFKKTSTSFLFLVHFSRLAFAPGAAWDVCHLGQLLRQLLLPVSSQWLLIQQYGQRGHRQVMARWMAERPPRIRRPNLNNIYEIFFCCTSAGLVIPTAVWICMGYGETLFKSPLAVDIGSIIRDCFVAFPGFNFARGIMALVQVMPAF